MKAALDFEWPKALRAVRRAAEDGTLGFRPLYPVEVKALCELVAGAPLDGCARDIAPGMTVRMRWETRDAFDNKRAAFFFLLRFSNGRVWQCSLFTAWGWGGDVKRLNALTAFSPKNIVQAVTRSIALRQDSHDD